MRLLMLSALAFVLVASAVAQSKKEQRDEDFLKDKPAIGDPLPEVTVYAPDGKEVSTASLRGHYTVLTFGCLT
jgi:cytochrome oxidase Cu insertion factor (SCO1/SenC/PrrC family)